MIASHSLSEPTRVGPLETFAHTGRTGRCRDLRSRDSGGYPLRAPGSRTRREPEYPVGLWVICAGWTLVTSFVPFTIRGGAGTIREVLLSSPISPRSEWGDRLVIGMAVCDS